MAGKSEREVAYNILANHKAKECEANIVTKLLFSILSWKTYTWKTYTF